MSLRLILNDGVEIDIDDSDGDMELVSCSEIDELRLKADLWDAKSRVAEYRANAMLDDGRVLVSKARLRHLEAQAKKLAAVTAELDEMRKRRFAKNTECVVLYSELARLRQKDAAMREFQAWCRSVGENGGRVIFVQEEWYRRACVAMGKEHT
jgi:hypothetical protein